MTQTELLAPAGNMASVYQAIHHGANAVYIGGKNFGARAYANNFSYDEMKQAIDFAHLYGARVYVTVNTLIYQSEVRQFLAHVQKIYETGADALIMQDIGMIARVHACFPDIEIHASTQMHNHNDACLYFAQSLGMARAVLAREMNKEQIRSLTCDIEKEVFIHGALCICYSGQCIFSALTQQRSGNRGRCAQSCRMRYSVVDSSGDVQPFDGAYLLSSKDIAVFKGVQDLLQARVQNFKIEGRMKSPEYVGQVTKIYADLLSNYEHGRGAHVNSKDRAELAKLFNRGFTKGHLFSDTGSKLMGRQRPNHRGAKLGVVTSVQHDRIVVQLDDVLTQGDGIKFSQSDTGFICNKIYRNGKLVRQGQSGEVVSLDKKAKARVGERVVKTSDTELEKRLQRYEQKRIPICAHVTAKKDEALVITFSDDDGHAISVNGDKAEQSKMRPTTYSDIEVSISKLGDTPFVLTELSIDTDEDIFIAKSAINALRRKASDELIQVRIQRPMRRVVQYKHSPVRHSEPLNKCQLHVLVRNEAQLTAVMPLTTGDIYTSDKQIYVERKHVMPSLRLKTDKLAKDTPVYAKERLLVTDSGGLHVYHENNDITVDYSLCAFNTDTLSFFAKKSAKRIALSPELSVDQVREMMYAYDAQNGQKPTLEALIYARFELMAMRHCVISGDSAKHCGRCAKERYYLKDIHGLQFPIVTDEQCNNYILGQLHESTKISELKHMGVRHFRIELLHESVQESKRIVSRYIAQIGE